MDSFSSCTHLIYLIQSVYPINCSQLPMQIHVHCTVSDSTSLNDKDNFVTYPPIGSPVQPVATVMRNSLIIQQSFFFQLGIHCVFTNQPNMAQVCVYSINQLNSYI